MRLVTAATACALSLSMGAPSIAVAASYVVTPLKKAQKIGQVLPATLSDSGVVLGTVGVAGVGTLAVETNPAFASTADHCGLSGAADNTTITGSSPYSIQQFVVGSCSQDTGYLYDVQKNTTTFLSYAHSIETSVVGVNSEGLAAGLYADMNNAFHGFLYFQGTYTPIDAPGAFGTFPNGINAISQVYGRIKTVSAGDNSSGFLFLDFGTYKVIEGPNAFYTEVTGFNVNQQAVGNYIPNATGQSSKAFFWQNETMTTFPLDVTASYATAINEAGVVAGWYIDHAAKEHGFVWQPATGAVLTVNGPVSTRIMHLTAINNTGSEVTGYYYAGKHYVGFTATCTGTGCP